MENLNVKKEKIKDIKHSEAEIYGNSSETYLLAKRMFDFVSSFIVSLVIILPVAVIAVIIFIKDPGNPFYLQKRVGQNGETLKILKFRSMKKNADKLEKYLTPEQIKEYKKEYKLDDDPRLIGYRKAGDGKRCFGAKIRQWSIDELPQIIYNICILGNMSVVGPRPILADELAKNYTKHEKECFISVKPGLTGYWQAYARNNIGYENHKRQDMELYYVKNQSFVFDMKIIFKTIESVLRKKGAK
ncbi:MAG: sugar transferase [Ruminococcus flavefaciens]|nr:sugar transferase [Ruminococcus flavefaciens]